MAPHCAALLLAAMFAGQVITQDIIATRVFAVAVSFAEFVSIDVVLTFTIFVMMVPDGLSTLTTSVLITDAPGARFPNVQLIAPVPPTGGVVQLPELDSETKVVPAGILPLNCTLAAVLGPLLLATIV